MSSREILPEENDTPVEADTGLATEVAHYQIHLSDASLRIEGMQDPAQASDETASPPPAQCLEIPGLDLNDDHDQPKHGRDLSQASLWFEFQSSLVAYHAELRKRMTTTINSTTFEAEWLIEYFTTSWLCPHLVSIPQMKRLMHEFCPTTENASPLRHVDVLGQILHAIAEQAFELDDLKTTLPSPRSRLCQLLSILDPKQMFFDLPLDVTLVPFVALETTCRKARKERVWTRALTGQSFAMRRHSTMGSSPHRLHRAISVPEFDHSKIAFDHEQTKRRIRRRTHAASLVSNRSSDDVHPPNDEDQPRPRHYHHHREEGDESEEEEEEFIKGPNFFQRMACDIEHRNDYGRCLELQRQELEQARQDQEAQECHRRRVSQARPSNDPIWTRLHSSRAQYQEELTEKYRILNSIDPQSGQKLFHPKINSVSRQMLRSPTYTSCSSSSGSSFRGSSSISSSSLSSMASSSSSASSSIRTWTTRPQVTTSDWLYKNAFDRLDRQQERLAQDAAQASSQRNARKMTAQSRKYLRRHIRRELERICRGLDIPWDLEGEQGEEAQVDMISTFLIFQQFGLLPYVLTMDLEREHAPDRALIEKVWSYVVDEEEEEGAEGTPGGAPVAKMSNILSLLVQVILGGPTKQHEDPEFISRLKSNYVSRSVSCLPLRSSSSRESDHDDHEYITTKEHSKSQQFNYHGRPCLSSTSDDDHLSNELLGRRHELEAMKLAQEMRECTFHPKINPNSKRFVKDLRSSDHAGRPVYERLSSVSSRRRHNSENVLTRAQELELESWKECTFHPERCPSRPTSLDSSTTSLPEVRGFDQDVQRMRQVPLARAQDLKIDETRARRLAENVIAYRCPETKHIHAAPFYLRTDSRAQERHAQLVRAKRKTKHQKLSKQKKKDPDVIRFDVHMAPNWTETIEFCPVLDRPGSIAHEFAQVHHLDSNVERELKSQLMSAVKKHQLHHDAPEAEARRAPVKVRHPETGSMISTTVIAPVRAGLESPVIEKDERKTQTQDTVKSTCRGLQEFSTFNLEQLETSWEEFLK